MSSYEDWKRFVARYTKRCGEIQGSKLDDAPHPSLFICGLMKIHELTGTLDLTSRHDYVSAWELPVDMSQDDMDYLIKCGLGPVDDIELSWCVDHGVY